jgi:hypothetical protein
MAGLDPAIHVLAAVGKKAWMRGSSPRMTKAGFGSAAKSPALARKLNFRNPRNRDLFQSDLTKTSSERAPRMLPPARPAR